jgi:tight adherence protein C
VTLDLTLPLIAVFISVALATGTAVSLTLARTAPERRRLQAMIDVAPQNGLLQQFRALVRPKNRTKQLARVAGDASTRTTRLQRRLERAGWADPEAVSYFMLAEIVTPLLFVLTPLALFGLEGWLLATVAGIVGYLIPDLMLARATRRHQRAIQNGLPDALDLIVVCIEAGSSLDQAIIRASEELEIALPALARELRIVTGEIRAGKPRMEAFQSLAKRTGVEDVRALVAMLMQTDRFGTSIAQSLRTHANTSRTKRRQAAEERAAKVGVKLVFPLALCLVPSLYVVCLGPIVVRIVRALL